MGRGPEAGAAVVAAADRRLAETAISRRPEHAAVPRNDLSQPVRSDTGVLKKELMVPLRTRRQLRQAKRAATKTVRGQIADTTPIRERPAEAQARAIPGHWEGDLLCGSNRSCMVTLVERASRFVMLLKVPGSDTATVIGALTRNIGR